MRRLMAPVLLFAFLLLAACTPSADADKIGTPQDAVDAVFAGYGEREDLKSFPRKIGSLEGTVGIGGPPPGSKVPATYDTSASVLAPGVYQVRFTRRFQRNHQDEVTIWTFHVNAKGSVEDKGREGSTFAELAG